MNHVELVNNAISEVSLDLYNKGYHRESLVNAILALFDMIRHESGLQEDGSCLVGKAFSVESPRIILADLKTESGRNIQKGTIQILQGYFLAYRNVASHSLKVEFSAVETYSLLISISRLYEKIKVAEKATFLRYDGLYLRAEEDAHGDTCYLLFQFFEDGDVISVPVSLEEDESLGCVLTWFTRENAKDFKHYSHGTYTVDERKISYTTSCVAGEIRYKGIIRPNKLHLEIKSLINGNERVEDLEFRTWDQIKSITSGLTLS